MFSNGLDALNECLNRSNNFEGLEVDEKNVVTFMADFTIIKATLDGTFNAS